MAILDGPCAAWEPIWCVPLQAGSELVSGAAVMAATELLWALSGRRYGLCEETIRPCRHDCPDMDMGFPAGWTGGGGPRPALIGGRWFNLSCGGCHGDCSCASVSEALLPDPTWSVTAVKIDGDVIPTGSYRLDDHRLLVRTDGGTWPLCNNLSVGDDQPGTWSVTLQVGEPVPTLGQLAAGEVAAEASRALCGQDCRLPAGLTQLVRQGVTASYPDPATFLDRGLLGLPWADRFIAAANPAHHAARPHVYSPDTVRWRTPGGPP